MWNKIYFCNGSKVYRANLDGSNLETVLSISTSQCKLNVLLVFIKNCSHVFVLLARVAVGEMLGMTFDWIAGNVYVVTDKGYIWACDARPTRTFT